MYKFTEFLFEKKTKPYVHNEPIHFKMKKVKKLKSLKEDIYTKPQTVSDWMDKNDNEHLSNHADADIRNEKISDILHKKHDTTYNFKPDMDDHGYALAPHIHEPRAVTHYTQYSHGLNSQLIKRHNQEPYQLTPHDDKHIEDMDHVTNRSIGTHLHVYSGVRFDPNKIKNHNNIIHMPAYTSTTHSKEVAKNFSIPAEKGGPQHILHIHMKPEDKGFHVERHSDHPWEHETILPRNTQLKVHPEPDIHGDYHIWHATIHHQD